MMHPTHKARVSDSSLYDEVCVHCNLTDMSPGWSRPCKRAAATEPAARLSLDLTKPPFQTERGEPMHFVGHTKDGRTVWEDKEGWISSRRADGRLLAGGPDGDDVINAPPQPRTAYVTVYADGTHARVIGLVYPTKELAELYAKADKRVVCITQIELPEGFQPLASR